MSFDRLLADEDSFSDLLVGQAFGNQPENFHLTLGERLDAFIDDRCALASVCLSLNDFLEGFPGRDLLIDPNSAVMNDFNGLQ